MSSCLCCEMKLPASHEKVCPRCGHPFHGQGWTGVDSHWRAHHEREISFEAFWEGLCQPHRGPEPVAASGSPTIAEGAREDYARALAQRALHIENSLIHPLTAKLAMELWRRDPWLDLQIFRAEVGEAGFDLVLSCMGIVRYVQVKEAPSFIDTARFALREDLSKVPGACAVGLVHDDRGLDHDHALFFGGAPGEPMPAITAFPATRFPRRRAIDRISKPPEGTRDVPLARFEGPLGIPELVERLFPGLPRR